MPSANNQSFTQPAMAIETLPDFMQTPSPQVKFHSAFPPLTTKVRVRGVMERAGFDVYRPDKDKRSVFSPKPSQSFLTGSNHGEKFYPPNASYNRANYAKRSVSSNLNAGKSSYSLPTRKYSEKSPVPSSEDIEHTSTANSTFNSSYNTHENNQYSSNFRPQNIKSKQLNNSTPNLLQDFSSDQSNDNEKALMLSYARQQLNINSKHNIDVHSKMYENDRSYDSATDVPTPTFAMETQKKQRSTEQAEEFNTSPLRVPQVTITEEVDGGLFDTDCDGNDNQQGNNDEIPIIDDFKVSTKLPERTIPSIKGPRPISSHSNSFDRAEDANEVPSFADTDAQDQSANILHEQAEMDGNGANALSALQLPSMDSSDVSSRNSAISVGSFEEKFMLQGQNDEHSENPFEPGQEREHTTELQFPDQNENTSQETFGGLSGMGDAIRTSVPGPFTPLLPDLTNPYKADPNLVDDKTKRLSTLATKDTYIYNLQSLNDGSVDQITKEVDDLDIVNEHELRDSRGVQDQQKSVNHGINESFSADKPRFSDRFSHIDKELGDSSSVIHHVTAQEEEQYAEQESFGNPDLSADQKYIQQSNLEAPDEYAAESSILDHDKLIAIPPRHFEKEPLIDRPLESPNEQPLISAGRQEHHDSLSSKSDQSEHTDNVMSGVTTPEAERHQHIHEDGSKHSHNHIHDASMATAQLSSTVIHPPGEGPCRLCGLDIEESQKKIWSKDSQLSGQWHRKCFGCTTCGKKFSKGSSCYVFEDHPYCETHFHELNGSLCQVCNKGVEGECLQNEINEVFHVDCLKCVICGLNVEGDYFLFRDEVMCEMDARELMNQIEEAEREYDELNKTTDKMIKRKTRILHI